MAILDRFKKQPNDIFKYHIDYSEWLPTGVNVANSSVALVEVLNPASSDVGEPTLTITAPVVVGTDKIQYFASGGTDGKKYKVTFQTLMNDTQLVESEIEFKVNDL